MKLADELEALATKATPGPWYTLDPPWLPSGTETSILAESPDPHAARFICDFDLWALEGEDHRKSENPDADADLIVTLRNSLPAILVALRAAEPVEGEVTQADIEFAHDLAFKGFQTIHDYEMYVRKVAARHRALGRAEAFEEAAKVAERYNLSPEETTRDNARNATAQIIAAAIRALGEPKP